MIFLNFYVCLLLVYLITIATLQSELSGHSWVIVHLSQVQVMVRRTKGLVGQVQVRYTTSPGTATTGQDFYPAAGVLVFENGVDSQFVQVSLRPDDIPEGPETFFINITSVQLLSPRYGSKWQCFRASFILFCSHGLFSILCLIERISQSWMRFCECSSFPADTWTCTHAVSPPTPAPLSPIHATICGLLFLPHHMHYYWSK